MATSCSCLKLCSVVVAISNVAFGICVMIFGAFIVQDYLNPAKKTPIGLVIVYFQISSFLIFAGLLLLIGIIQGKEKIVSLYLLLSSLVWFIITTLAISYMLFYNPTNYDREPANATTTTTIAPTVVPKPKPKIPVEKAVGFSIGLVLIWCGQLGVYKFHDQVIEKNMIDAGESYVSSAIRTN